MNYKELEQCCYALYVEASFLEDFFPCERTVRMKEEMYGLYKEVYEAYLNNL